jgi:hypothetical protein
VGAFVACVLDPPEGARRAAPLSGWRRTARVVVTVCVVAFSLLVVLMIGWTILAFLYL